MATASNRHRIDAILARAVRAPARPLDPFAGIAPLHQQTQYAEPNRRVVEDEAELTLWDGADPNAPTSNFSFAPPDAPQAPGETFDPDAQWRDGPAVALGRARPSWLPDAWANLEGSDDSASLFDRAREALYGGPREQPRAPSAAMSQAFGDPAPELRSLAEIRQRWQDAAVQGATDVRNAIKFGIETGARITNPAFAFLPHNDRRAEAGDYGFIDPILAYVGDPNRTPISDMLEGLNYSLLADPSTGRRDANSRRLYDSVYGAPWDLGAILDPTAERGQSQDQIDNQRLADMLDPNFLGEDEITVVGERPMGFGEAAGDIIRNGNATPEQLNALGRPFRNLGEMVEEVWRMPGRSYDDQVARRAGAEFDYGLTGNEWDARRADQAAADMSLNVGTSALEVTPLGFTGDLAMMLPRHARRTPGNVARRVADEAPRMFEGAARPRGSIIDAEAIPVPSTRRTINLPEPFVGSAEVIVNPSRADIEGILATQGDMPSVRWGVDGNGDLLAWDGRATSHGMVSGDAGLEGGNFRVHGEIEDPLEIDAALSSAQRSRNEGPQTYAADDLAAELGISPETAQAMLDRDGRLAWPAYGERQQVRAGEQLNRDGSITPRTPIDWGDARTRLPADEEEFSRLAGAPVRAGDPLADIAPAALIGAGGGYAAGEILDGDEASADDGGAEEDGDLPILPILGAGGGAAALMALSRGRLADEFGDSVGMSGARSPRARSTNVTASEQPSANAPRTSREPGSMLTDSRLNRDQNYAAGRALDGLSPRAIAEEMDTTAGYVRVLLANARELAPDLNIPRGVPGRAQDGLTARARDLRSQGLSYEEIGEALGISATAAKSRVNLPRAGDPLGAIAPLAAAGMGGALALGDWDAEAEDDNDVINRSLYMEARAGEEEPDPEIPQAMRVLGGIGTGFIARAAASRLGLRGMARELPAAAAAAFTDYGLGGDPDEAAMVGGVTPALRYAGGVAGEHLLRGLDDGLDRAAERSKQWGERDHALANDPYHQTRAREFAMSLPGEAPRVRATQIEEGQTDVLRDMEGLRPFSVEGDEALEQGYARDLPGTEEISPRNEFLEMTPTQQESWMDRQHFRLRQDDWAQSMDGAQLGSSIERSAPSDARGADAPQSLDDIAPMPRQYRATPEDIMENPERGTLASPARHAQSLATIAEEFGVEVARGARGGINGKRTAANLARAAQSNPGLRAELRRRGLWAAVLTGGTAAGVAVEQGDDPLESVN